MDLIYPVTITAAIEIKLIQVISSCKTIEQLRVAYKMVKNAFRVGRDYRKLNELIGHFCTHPLLNNTGLNPKECVAVLNDRNWYLVFFDITNLNNREMHIFNLPDGITVNDLKVRKSPKPD